MHHNMRHTKIISHKTENTLLVKQV